MDKSRIPELCGEAKKRIKRIVSDHYGFVPADDDLRWIDQMLRNHCLVLHEQNIIRHVVDHEIKKQLLKHRDRLGSLEFERIWDKKIIFKYLTLASMCYRAGISAGAISLCRTAIESGLRERLAEELAMQETVNQDDLPVKTLQRLCQLRDENLASLIKKVSEAGIISKMEIEKAFHALKFREQSSKRVLDKFIHGDLVWVVEFVKSREENTRVVDVRDELEEFKTIVDMKTEQIAVEVLKGSYQIAVILYLQ
jgi:hypothetical protein